MTRWIKIEDSLPKDGQQVLIYGEGSKGKFLSDAKFIDKEFLLYEPEYDTYSVCTIPTHWTKLPPPPK